MKRDEFRSGTVARCSLIGGWMLLLSQSKTSLFTCSCGFCPVTKTVPGVMRCKKGTILTFTEENPIKMFARLLYGGYKFR